MTWPGNVSIRGRNVPRHKFMHTLGKMIQVITEDGDLLTALGSHKSGLVVVDFFATWCGPCHHVEGPFEDLASRYPQVHFARVDVEQCPKISTFYEVSALPTFLFLSNGNKVDSVVGGDIQRVESLLQSHSSQQQTFSGAAHRIGNDQISPPQQQQQQQMDEDDIQLFVATLCSMGISQKFAEDAFSKGGCTNLDEALIYCTDLMEDNVERHEKNETESNVDKEMDVVSDENPEKVDEESVNVEPEMEIVSDEKPKESEDEKKEEKVQMDERETRTRALELQAAARKKRMEKEKEESLQRERQRRVEGKVIQSGQSDWKERERQTRLMEIQKEKKEKIAERARVKALLAEDRKRRRQEMGKSGAEEGEQKTVSKNVSSSNNVSHSSSRECTLQVRQMNGSLIRFTLPSEATIREVHAYLKQRRTDGSFEEFYLVQPFPRVVYDTEVALNRTLIDEHLAPRGQLFMTPL